MRPTSALFVAAHIRRCFSEDAPAVVMRRGAEEAGAIFVLVDRLDGTSDLYGPAPQTAFETERPAGRLFQLIAERADSETITKRLQREVGFDPDIWVIAIEDRTGRSFLELTS